MSSLSSVDAYLDIRDLQRMEEDRAISDMEAWTPESKPWKSRRVLRPSTLR